MQKLDLEKDDETAIGDFDVYHALMTLSTSFKDSVASS